MLTTLEKQLLASLKQAIDYIEHVKAFEGRATSRVEGPAVLETWKKQNRNTRLGITYGLSYLPDAEFDYSGAKMLVFSTEALA